MQVNKQNKNFSTFLSYFRVVQLKQEITVQEFEKKNADIRSKKNAAIFQKVNTVFKKTKLE